MVTKIREDVDERDAKTAERVRQVDETLSDHIMRG